jgi:mRNA interferase RelE/StbE
VTYTIGFKPSALRQLRKLNQEIQKALVEAIETLADNPRPNGCKKLKGEFRLYRIRVANTYRVIYEVQDRQFVVTVLKVGHRRDIY